MQADVASSQRFSLSSETTSATTSLSEKSLADDGGASTRALAGSVLNYKVTISGSIFLSVNTQTINNDQLQNDCKLNVILFD